MNDIQINYNVSRMGFVVIVWTIRIIWLNCFVWKLFFWKILFVLMLLNWLFACIKKLIHITSNLGINNHKLIFWNIFLDFFILLAACFNVTRYYYCDLFICRTHDILRTCRCRLLVFNIKCTLRRNDRVKFKSAKNEVLMNRAMYK